ncbi:uncharacterized protein G2W53_004770 [Senna tora]|uniref:Uncharacterized protein n=1 Tax=Senna tora TaxID=362788 RepID=A0A834XCS4_9FABA|nr:uncharacterized protein G2W53_004770 [Senna tora]
MLIAPPPPPYSYLYNLFSRKLNGFLLRITHLGISRSISPELSSSSGLRPRVSAGGRSVFAWVPGEPLLPQFNMFWRMTGLSTASPVSCSA